MKKIKLSEIIKNKPSSFLKNEKDEFLKNAKMHLEAAEYLATGHLFRDAYISICCSVECLFKHIYIIAVDDIVGKVDFKKTIVFEEGESINLFSIDKKRELKTIGHNIPLLLECIDSIVDFESIENDWDDFYTKQTIEFNYTELRYLETNHEDKKDRYVFLHTWYKNVFDKVIRQTKKEVTNE